MLSFSSGSRGLTLGAPTRDEVAGEGADYAHMYRNSCTPMADGGANSDESFQAIYGILLPFVGVASSIGGFVWLMARTVNAEQYTPIWIKWALIAVSAIATVVALTFWRRVWRIDDMPTIEVAGAHPGACEFVGRARTGAPTAAWFSGEPAIWYEAELMRRTSDREGKVEWRKVWSSEGGHKNFWLDDGTGLIAVNSRGAASSGGRTIVDRRQGEYRMVERALLVDQRLFVTGPVQIEANGSLCVRRQKSKGELGATAPFWIAHSEKRIRSSMRGAAVFATAIAAIFAAGSSIFTTVPSTAPEHLDRQTLLVSENPILVPFLIVLGVMVGLQLLHYGVRLFNRLVELKHQAAFAWANIDVATARRRDLISRLTGTTEAAATHERTALVEAIRSRSKLPSGARIDRLNTGLEADRAERANVGRVHVALQEGHPDIVAAEVFERLFASLVEAEDRIAASRKFYNDAVTVLSDRSRQFPGILLAPLVVGGGLPPLLTFELA